MSSRRSASHSTGSEHAAYVEEASTFTRSPPSTETSESLSSESSGWDSLDDIGPSDSASRPPRVPSVERHARRTRKPSHHEPRPTSTRRKSSNRIPTIREEERRGHRSSSDHSDRRERHYREERDREREREHHRHAREHRPRLSSSGSSSVESDYAYMGGGHHYSDLPHHPHPHAGQWGPPPSNYPPTVLSGHPAYDAQARQIRSPYDPAALIHMPRQDYMDPMSHPGGYASPASNPFGHPSQNPFSPMASHSPVTAGADYFGAPYEGRPSPFEGRPSPYENRPSPHPGQHSSHSLRPMGRSRPQSYAGASPYAMETALSPFYPPSSHSGMPGYPPSTIDHRAIAAHMLELQEAKKSASVSPEPVKPKTPAPAPAPAPEVVKAEPKEDQAVKLMALIAEHEEKKRLAAEERAKADALAAAQSQAAKEAAEAESSKIAKLLMQFEEERLKREKEMKDKADADKQAAEAKAAREAEIAAAAQAAKTAAEKEAADKLKAAEEEATKKMKAAEEEATKKLAEATAAAEALEKAKKALEEDLAKHAPDPDSAKKSVHFEDVLGRKYDVPWRFAKTWKGMKSLIEQAFNHVDVVGQPVMDGRYDLIGPDNMIILPQVWDIIIQPEWVIKMELWPTPEPEPAMPGGFPSDYYMPELGRPTKKTDKKSKTPSSKPAKATRGPQVVEVSPAAHAAGAIPVPPHFAAYADDPVIGMFDASKMHKPSGSTKPKEKKKPPARTGFTSWMLGAPRPAKPAGKEIEKPGQLVHFVAPPSSSDPPHHPASLSFVTTPVSVPSSSSANDHGHHDRHHDKHGHGHDKHDRRRSSTHRRDSGADGFLVLDRHSSKTLPSAQQGASVRKGSHGSHDSHTRQADAACMVM